MARKIIIGEILNLIKGLGGNPQKFMGTKTNINFLGKGPKEALFQGQIDIRGMQAADFPLETVISEAETAGGYAVANKLNDLQLQRLRDNLITLKEAYKPPVVANITDMGTGTGDLTPGGLEYLRRTGKTGATQTTKNLEPLGPGYTTNKPITYKNPETGETMAISLGSQGPREHATLAEAMKLASAESNAMRKQGLDPSKYEDFLKWEEIKKQFQIHDEDIFEGTDLSKAGISTLTKRIQDRMAKIKKMSDELGEMGKADVRKDMTYTIVDPTAEKTSYASRFNPKNEVHVEKAKALLEDPQIKGVYTEAEVKNAYDFEGLYQNHFDKGHVDGAMLLEQAGHNIPQMRASARDALLTLMKKETGLPGAEQGLRNFVDEIDFKYITEGGGGRAGDPVNLFVKYFGKNAAENLPKNATKENINKFTDFILDSKDARGRSIDDPFFDRESIDFSTLKGIVDDLPPFKTGGRVGFKWGSGLSKSLLRKINKKMINDDVDDIFTTGDYKMDAEIAAEALVENNPKLFGNKLIDDLDDAARSDVYGLVLEEVTARFGLNLKKQKGIKSLIKGVDEQFGEGTLKRASELPKGTKYETLEAIKDFEARNRTFTPNREKIRAYYQGKIDDELLDKILADNNPQRIAEVLATIDEALLMQGRGIGPETIMQSLKDSWGRKPSASGGLAKILEV